MFYQNNDYMRDAFYYSTPQNFTYQNGYTTGAIPVNSMNTLPNQNVMMTNVPRIPITDMYPQIYRIINPVANRVISSNNSQFVTEDTLNNMVDTVYNIVEGDISSLTSTNDNISGDDSATQGGVRNAQSITNNNSRQNNLAEGARISSAVTQSERNRADNQLLRDLIKIIIIKEILSRQCNRFFNANCQNGYRDSRMYGMMYAKKS